MDMLTTPSNWSNRLLRPSEVAEMLNISKSLAYRLLEQGQIPTIRFNRTVRVRQIDLNAYIQKCWRGAEGFPNQG